MTVTPAGEIHLCITPLENNYKHQLTFSNATTQLQYFYSKISQSLSNYTYIKKDNSIKVGLNIDTIINCNYLYYKNNGFTNKVYYCFITNMEYINENCTLITFETDVFQTYQFDIVYNSCFIEREHVDDDTVGKHTVPENLELGEMVCNSAVYFDDLDTKNYMLQVTEYMSEEVDKPLATNYGGVFYAGRCLCNRYIFKFNFNITGICK